MCCIPNIMDTRRFFLARVGIGPKLRVVGRIKAYEMSTTINLNSQKENTEIYKILLFLLLGLFTPNLGILFLKRGLHFMTMCSIS